jgi:hypothetical protein
MKLCQSLTNLKKEKESGATVLEAEVKQKRGGKSWLGGEGRKDGN